MTQKLSFNLAILISLMCFNGLCAQSSLKNLFNSIDKTEFSLIVEGGTLRSNVYTSTDFFDSELTLREKKQFESDEDIWGNNGGFHAGIKVAKKLNSNLLDSKISLDFITGISYQQYNIFQRSYDPHANTSFSFTNCFGFNYFRDLKLKNISIPMELRSNFSIWNFAISPTIGFGVNIPLSKHQELYYSDYVNNQIVRGTFVEAEKVEANEIFTFNTISKIEVSYQLANNHKIKCAGFYNLNITNEFSDQLRNRQGVSSKGIQVAYEVPLTCVR